MLTKDQFYITSQIEKEIETDTNIFMFNMSLTEGEHPYYDFVSNELENFPRLLFMLNLIDKKQEFLINSLYFLYFQEKYYKRHGMPYYSICEFIFKDIIDVYYSYNRMPINIEEGVDFQLS